MNNVLKVFDENNELIEIEVLNFYQLEEYDHEYILYTKNEEADEDNIITYVSILNQISDTEYSLERITNKEEENKIDELIEKDIEELSKLI